MEVVGRGGSESGAAGVAAPFFASNQKRGRRSGASAGGTGSAGFRRQWCGCEGATGHGARVEINFPDGTFTAVGITEG